MPLNILHVNMIYVNKLNSVFEMEKSMGDRLREAREVAGYMIQVRSTLQ